MAKKLTDIRSMARVHTPMCIRTLAAIAKQPKAPEGARVNACCALLDRGWGKPAQPMTGDEDNPIRITIRKMLNEDLDDFDPKGG